MQLPSGTVAEAPGTTLTQGPQGWRTGGPHSLSGDLDQESWDQQLSRWVPASPPEISPTGTQYAYAYATSSGAEVHLVTPALGSDDVLASGGDYQVLGWQGEQIILAGNSTAGSGAEGLYRLSPGTGATATLQVPAAGVAWYMVGPGAIWGSDVNAADPAPPAAGPGDQLLRFDETTGKVAAWSYQPGLTVVPVAVTAAGDPVEEVQSPTSTFVQVATGPSTATRLLEGAGLNSLMPLEVTSSLTDSHGTWLTTDSGLYVLTPQLKLLLEQTGNFANAAVVGPCA